VNVASSDGAARDNDSHLRHQQSRTSGSIISPEPFDPFQKLGERSKSSRFRFLHARRATHQLARATSQECETVSGADGCKVFSTAERTDSPIGDRRLYARWRHGNDRQSNYQTLNLFWP
jgi:hypothetical protein